MKIGIVVNDIGTEISGYTTTHLAMTATNMGHEVWYMGVADFAYDPDENVHARARTVIRKRYRSAAIYLANIQSNKAVCERITLDNLDVLLLRDDPAQDVISRPWARLAGINFGRLALRHGVIVLNDPNGLLQAVNKMYLQYFPEEVRPRSLITRDRAEICAFVKDQGGWGVLKPLTGSGGRNVFLVRPEDDANINQMIEAVGTEGYVLAQEYLPQAVTGDTRLFMLNGRPLFSKGSYAAVRRVRRPGDSDIRNNMTAGAVARPAKVDDQLLAMAEIVRPKLVQDGMFLVGLDVVGNKLMEINVFSPGGLWGAQRLTGVNFFQAIILSLEKKVDYMRHYHRRFDNAEMATL